MKTAEEICRELWMALDHRAKTAPFSPRVREITQVLGVAQALVVQIEALLKSTQVTSPEEPR